MANEQELTRAGITDFTTEELRMAELTEMTVDEARPWLARRAANRKTLEKRELADAAEASVQALRERKIRDQFSALSGGSL